MRLFLLTCLVMVCTMAQATVYKWVDENGNVHYSDEPTKNAEVVELKENTHNKIIIPRAISSSSASDNQGEDAIEYKVSITSPSEEDTIRDNDGKISISARITPEAPKSALYTLYMDGNKIGDAQRSSIFQLEDINRGEHRFVVKMITQVGKVLASSSPRTVFLHRARARNAQ